MSTALRELGIGFDQVQDVAARILARGVHLGASFSVGMWAPAIVIGGHEWAVLDLRGDPVVLCLDAYEAAVRFLEYEAGAVEIETGDPGIYPFRQDTDAYLAAVTRWDWWFAEGRFSPRGDPNYDPPYPRRGDYEP